MTEMGVDAVLLNGTNILVQVLRTIVWSVFGAMRTCEETSPSPQMRGLDPTIVLYHWIVFFCSFSVLILQY